MLEELEVRPLVEAAEPAPWTARRVALLVFGHLFFVVGAAGLFVPLLPTTIFWIGAAFCFARSSIKMQRRIYGAPKVGRIVEDMVEYGIATRGTKWTATMGILATFAITGLLVSKLWVLGVIAGVLAGVLLYLWTRPEARADV